MGARLPVAQRGPARVMMVVPQYPYPIVGGLELQAHELSMALQRLGHDVQAISGRLRADQPALERVDGIRVHRIPWTARKAVRFVRTPADVLHALFKLRHTFDVVHSHQCSWFGLFVILAAAALGKPILTKLPSVGAAGIPGMAASRFGAAKLAILRRSDAVVAMSTESVAELHAIGFPAHRVLATPNGIRLRTRYTEPDADRRRSESGEPCRVVFVGRLAHEKRVDDLLAAWSRVQARYGQSARLELWGSGPLESQLRAVSIALGIEASVVFRGYVDDVRGKLGMMDVFVLPSSAEGNSNAVLEAMAAGLPVVSTRVGGTPMLVGAEGARHLVEPGDRDGLAGRLCELIADAALRRRTGAAMSRRVHERFDIDVVARTYAAAYAKLALGRRDEVGDVGTALAPEG